jgi:hypothetical protein
MRPIQVRAPKCKRMQNVGCRTTDAIQGNREAPSRRLPMGFKPTMSCYVHRSPGLGLGSPGLGPASVRAPLAPGGRGAEAGSRERGKAPLPTPPAPATSGLCRYGARSRSIYQGPPPVTGWFPGLAGPEKQKTGPCRLRVDNRELINYKI